VQRDEVAPVMTDAIHAELRRLGMSDAEIEELPV
jgi:hypothetical protein